MSEQQQSIEDIIKQKGLEAAETIRTRHQRFRRERPSDPHWSDGQVEAAAERERKIAEFFARRNLATSESSDSQD